MPRIEKTECSLDETRGKNKTDLPTNSKWQIGLLLWQKVARREPERSAASAKRAVTTHWGIPKGAALGAPLVTFPATGKSPGCRAERLLWGAQRGETPRRGKEGTSLPRSKKLFPPPPFKKVEKCCTIKRKKTAERWGGQKWPIMLLWAASRRED